MTQQEALYELGVRPDTLTEAEQQSLDKDGLLYLHGLMSSKFVDQCTRRLEQIAAEEGDMAGHEVHTEKGTTRLSDLVNKDPIFDCIYTNPRVLAAIAHVIPGDIKFSSLNSRAALPGEGLQWLHADWDKPVEPGDYCVCNSIWLLDDFTRQNGATRVVPGSHRSGLLPQNSLADRAGTHPDEVLVTGPRGTVVIFNSHLWHGGTRNNTDLPRRAMHGYFCRRDQQQQTDQRQYLRPETAARISNAAKWVLDIL